MERELVLSPFPESRTGSSSGLLLDLMNEEVGAAVSKSLEVFSILSSRSDLRRDQTDSVRGRKGGGRMIAHLLPATRRHCLSA